VILKVPKIVLIYLEITQLAFQFVSIVAVCNLSQLRKFYRDCPTSDPHEGPSNFVSAVKSQA